MSYVSIVAENLGKRYRIGELQKYKALRDTLTDALHAPFHAAAAVFRGRLSTREDGSVENFIWALKDVSFEIWRGEAVGVIGANGAGKSTLLKILSRITAPTEGLAQIRGKVGSLLEVGTGFHPELTGRENIYLNGAILGMKKTEIKGKFDEIVSFAEVEKFIDTPVKHYSTGMHVRLAFAVAAHLEPEILLVDEVLAVGDVAFQKKCLGKMGDVTKEGRTVLFVSHNMGAVRSLCSRAILVGKGRILTEGDPSQVISAYLSSGTTKGDEGEVIWSDEDQAPGDADLKLRSIRLIGSDGQVHSTFEVNKPIQIEISYKVNRALRGVRLRLALLTAQGEVAFQTTDYNVRLDETTPGIYRSVCTIPEGLLNIGQYVVRIGGGIPGVKVLLPYTRIHEISDSGGRESGI